MSKTYIPLAVRRLVIKRADEVCEYCRVPSLFSESRSYHIDHIISEKHGGKTEAVNLALACPSCNIAKGSDITSLLPGNNRPILLFNPRSNYWYNHFSLSPEGVIVGLTDEGKVTVNLLKLNLSGVVVLRKMLSEGGITILPNRRKV